MLSTCYVGNPVRFVSKSWARFMDDERSHEKRLLSELSLSNLGTPPIELLRHAKTLKVGCADVSLAEEQQVLASLGACKRLEVLDLSLQHNESSSALPVLTSLDWLESSCTS